MEKIKLPQLKKVDPNKPKKKKILLLSDDLRVHSGIATMSREFVIGTSHIYDWVQIGGAVKHPEEGKIFDISADINKEAGIDNASVKIYATSGYGNPQILQEVMNREMPDAILHFTDPRFWEWLYQIEQSIRQHIPIMYYNIWDDLPYPFWNEPFYESCDLLMNISRQTQNIVKNVLRKFPKPDWAVQWVPHGVNENRFFKVETLHPQYEEYNKFIKQTQLDQYDFILFWNNRNIRRKQPGDLILAYKDFCDKLSAEEASKCLLLMHTQASDPNGTDLMAVKEAICPNYNIMFSTNSVDTKILNFYYNIADVTINIASNEGFGISWCESLHTGTPIINNVTGGLQDGCRFENATGDWIEFDTQFSTNHDGTYKTHAEWVKPVFPTNRSLQGSPMTPYIFDDRADFKDVADAIKYWYELSNSERSHFGELGRQWVLGDESNMSSKNMSKRFIECINECLDKWTKRKRFTLYKINKLEKIKNPGII
jgi:glycosyltransferase involved in cell wall biosynthesis